MSDERRLGTRAFKDIGHCSPAVTQKRVEHLVGLLARGEYERRVTPDRLAQEWGVSPKTVESLAAEAGRRIDSALDPAEIRRLFGNGARVVFLRNLERENDDLVLRAIEVGGRFLGAASPDRVHVTGASVSAEEWDQFRADVMAVLCPGCREALARRASERAGGAPSLPDPAVETDGLVVEDE